MFKLVLVTVLLGLAAAENIDKNAEVKTLSNVPADAEGNFAYNFETSNGIAVQESGNLGGVTGSAQWVSPEGVPVKLSYVANENGYQPEGALLPVAPPIPEQIIRAIKYIEAHPPKDELLIKG